MTAVLDEAAAWRRGDFGIVTQRSSTAAAEQAMAVGPGGGGEPSIWRRVAAMPRGISLVRAGPSKLSTSPTTCP